MTRHQKTAPAGDLGGLIALIELADEAAGELVKLQTERGRLQELFRRASAEFTRQLEAGDLPVTGLANLARISSALSDTEAEIEARLTRLHRIIEAQHPINVSR